MGTMQADKTWLVSSYFSINDLHYKIIYDDEDKEISAHILLYIIQNSRQCKISTCLVTNSAKMIKKKNNERVHNDLWKHNTQ